VVGYELGKPSVTTKRLLNRDEEVDRQRQPSDHSLWIGDEFKRMRNWLDLFRGLAGGAAVVYALPVFSGSTHGGARELSSKARDRTHGRTVLGRDYDSNDSNRRAFELNPADFLSSWNQFCAAGAENWINRVPGDMGDQRRASESLYIYVRLRNINYFARNWVGSWTTRKPFDGWIIRFVRRLSR